MHPPIFIFLLLVTSTLALALLLLLWVPLVCRFELKRDQGRDPVQRIEVRWLFISRIIDGFEAAGREERRARDVGAEMSIRRIFDLFRTLHRPATTLVRKVVQRVDFRELSCNATFGLNDPAETGMLSGFLYAAFAPLSRYPAVSVHLHPVFHEQAFAYHIAGSINVTAERMIIPVIKFLCDRTVRRMITRRVRGSLSSSYCVPDEGVRKVPALAYEQA